LHACGSVAPYVHSEQPAGLPLPDEDLLLDRGFSTRLVAEHVDPGIYGQRVSVELFGDELSIDVDTYVEEVVPVGIARADHNARHPRLDLLEPPRTVLSHDKRALLCGALHEKRTRLDELVLIPQELSLVGGGDAFGDVGVSAVSGSAQGE
jgi:hypothetical protein